MTSLWQSETSAHHKENTQLKVGFLNISCNFTRLIRCKALDHDSEKFGLIFLTGINVYSSRKLKTKRMWIITQFIMRFQDKILGEVCNIYFGKYQSLSSWQFEKQRFFVLEESWKTLVEGSHDQVIMYHHWAEDTTLLSQTVSWWLKAQDYWS